MKYIAKENIGDYKIGDEVPAELAVTWSEMYDESPVELIKEVVKAEPVKEAVVEVVSKKKSSKKKVKA